MTQKARVWVTQRRERQTGLLDDPVGIPWRTLAIIGVAAAAVTFILLVAGSLSSYDNYALSSDFGIYHQAWYQIAHGQLNPVDTISPKGRSAYGIPYLDNHFELIFWPLSLLYFIYPHSIDLLLVQDAATAATLVVAFLFVCDMLRKEWTRSGRSGTIVAVVVLAVLVADPFTYWAASGNFHLQAVATLFLVLAARDLFAGHRGHKRRSYLWMVALLACGDVAATYLIGLGLSALVSGRETAKVGGMAILTSLAWLALVSALHANHGSDLVSFYGYLASHPIHSGGIAAIMTILLGIVTHPSTPIRQIGSRLGDLSRMILGAGTIGLASIIGAGVSLVVLVVNALSAGNFLQPRLAFQDFPALVFIAIGIASVTAWLGKVGRVGFLLSLALLAVSLAGVAVTGTTWFPKLSSSLASQYSANTPILVQAARTIPSNAEVVATSSVIGRFSGHRYVYPLAGIRTLGESNRLATVTTEPISTRTVFFIVVTDTKGQFLVAPSRVMRYAASYLSNHYHTTTVAKGGDVVVLRAYFPPRVHSIDIPVPLGVLFGKSKVG